MFFINQFQDFIIYPDECELHEGMPFNCTILEVKTNLSRVDKLVDHAYNILNEKIPNSSKDCGYCRWKEFSIE